ncbi:transmembrane protein 209-like [Plakobranchus ocellatus]|uniref:Transmembrane protein 209-like n=1 Tax=Plakobranchus ocellatus TaxID=259542 RepID=A0AAV4B7J9_9GAST|nr:transmembrane protein 209-like [Plakobranchus ocellatus]
MPGSPYQSDVIEKSWKKLHLAQAARQAAVSSLKISCIFFLLFVDLSYAFISGLFLAAHPLIWFIELSVAILLVFQIISNGLVLCRYFWAYLFGSAVNVTDDQRRLMAIPINDRSFRTPQRTLPGSSTQVYTASPNIDGFDTPQFNTSAGFTSLSHSPSQLYGNTSLHSSSFLSPHSSMHSTPSFQRSFNASFNSSLDKSLNVSGLSQSSDRYEHDRSSVRSRRSASVPVSTRSSRYARITDVDTLNKYINQEEEKELNRSQASPENLSSGNMSFWTYGSNPSDFLHILRRFAYQLSPTSSATPTLNSSSDQIDNRGVGEAWIKYGVSEDELYKWMEKLRKWLSFTIISRLNAEIEEVNSTLQKIGCEDTQIGEVGVSTLKQLALTKGNFVPTLNALVPYLDHTANQEYLRKRIRDLSTGSISAFTWDKGGDYGKTWASHLPTDASLVMHLFCCYLDSRLPAEPKYPDGTSFTAQHFLKTPDKPNLERKENIIIYQSNINPPHFQVVIGSQTYNLSQGRNNMFQAILLFLYHIRVKESGMLGRVNLGMSGLNMLWIFD